MIVPLEDGVRKRRYEIEDKIIGFNGRYDLHLEYQTRATKVLPES